MKWPDRGVLTLTMPSSLRKFFRSCAVIIECTEIFMKRPSDLLARTQAPFTRGKKQLEKKGIDWS